MSDSASAATIDDQGDKPRRGRPRGSKNKRTVEVARLMGPLAPKARATLLRLMQADDPELALRSAQLTLAYLFGRPTERKEVATDATVQTDTRSVSVDATGVALRLAHSLGMPIRLGNTDAYVPDALAAELPELAAPAEPVEIPDNGHHAPDVEVARRIAWLVENAGAELSERLGLGPKPEFASPDSATQAAATEPQQQSAETQGAVCDPVTAAGMGDAEQDGAPEPMTIGPGPLVTIEPHGSGWRVGGCALVQPHGDRWRITRHRDPDQRVLAEYTDPKAALRNAREMVADGRISI